MVTTGEKDVRRLLVQWRNDFTSSISPVGLLERRGTYRFTYLPNSFAVPGFRPFPAFPEVDKPYEAERLFDFFATRVMDRRRPEFDVFVQALGLTPNTDIVTILARSGGRRRGDFVSVVEEPTVAVDGSTSHLFMVAGVRHVADLLARDKALSASQQGAALTVLRQQDNPVNAQALVVATAGGSTALGWVPDGLVPYVSSLLRTGTLAMEIVRVNGPEQPDQLRLLVKVRGQLPAAAAALPQLLVPA